MARVSAINMALVWPHRVDVPSGSVAPATPLHAAGGLSGEVVLLESKGSLGLGLSLGVRVRRWRSCARSKCSKYTPYGKYVHVWMATPTLATLTTAMHTIPRACLVRALSWMPCGVFSCRRAWLGLGLRLGLGLGSGSGVRVRVRG